MEYKESNDELTEQSNRIDEAKLDADDPPVEMPEPISYIPPYDKIINRIIYLFDNDRNSPELLQLLQEFSISLKIPDFPVEKIISKYDIFQLLLSISSQSQYDILQQMGLTLINQILSQNDKYVILFVNIEGSVEALLSLLQSECTSDFFCTIIEILFYIFKEKTVGRKQLDSLSFVPYFLEICENISESIQEVPLQDIVIDKLTDQQKIIKQSLSIFDIVLQNINDYSEEDLMKLIHIFIVSYRNPFNDLIIFTLPLLRQIFAYYKKNPEKGPWDVLNDSGLLEICCTMFQDLPPIFQDTMLQLLIYLTSFNDEDGHALILSRINLSTIFNYLMSFDPENGFFEERFKSASKVASNILRFQPDALKVVLSEEIHGFYNTIFDQGTADVKRILGFGIFAMLDNLSGSEILELFDSDIVLNAFISLETATGEDLYTLLLNLSRSLYHIFGVRPDIINTNENYQQFKDECVQFLQSLEESDDSKTSLLASSMLSDYFQEAL